MCVLRKLKWVTGTGSKTKYAVANVTKYINKSVSDANTKKALLGFVNKCKKLNFTTKTKVTGANAGLIGSAQLACIEQLFSTWCAKNS
jgi:hypothetical protein